MRPVKGLHSTTLVCPLLLRRRKEVFATLPLFEKNTQKNTMGSAGGPMREDGAGEVTHILSFSRDHLPFLSIGGEGMKLVPSVS